MKATASVGRNDGKWLAKLRDRLGARFTGGVVLHTGRSSGPLGDKIAAVPLDILWTA